MSTAKPMTDDEAREKAWAAHYDATSMLSAEGAFNAGWKAAIEHERSKREALVDKRSPKR